MAPSSNCSLKLVSWDRGHFEGFLLWSFPPSSGYLPNYLGGRHITESRVNDWKRPLGSRDFLLSALELLLLLWCWILPCCNTRDIILLMLLRSFVCFVSYLYTHFLQRLNFKNLVELHPKVLLVIRINALNYVIWNLYAGNLEGKSLACSINLLVKSVYLFLGISFTALLQYTCALVHTDS